MIAPKSEQPARILIIDDQEQNIRLLARILQRAGYENIASTTNPSHARAIQSQFNPDLVLLDVHMGGKDGFEVLTEAPNREDVAAKDAFRLFGFQYLPQ
jgi:putative two-component system response regulator